jgi:hypothetical protein
MLVLVSVSNANAQMSNMNMTNNNPSSMSMSMSNANQTSSMAGMNTNNKTTVIRDSETILLEGKTLPANDYIHLYDTTPYHIVSGHVAIKVPCDPQANSKVQVLVGSAPNLKPSDFEYIKELSHPGNLCLYHVDLMSNSTNMITDIALFNPGNQTITFPPTSTVVIGVNEIAPGAPEEMAHGGSMG